MKHMYDGMTAMLAEPGDVQNYLLDRYRATPAFRDAYGQYMLATQRSGKLVEAAVSAARDFLGDEGISIEKHGGLIGDMLYTRYVLGFKYWEYFAYGLRDRGIGDRLAFLPEAGRKAYTRVLNPDHKRNLWFSDKSKLCAAMPGPYRRDMLFVGPGSDYKAFLAFLGRHSRFLAKPPKGSLGSGVRILDTSGMSGRQVQVLFKRLQSEENGSLCEEVIRQAPEMAAIHPESVNSVRMTTYLSPEGAVRPVCAYLRSGLGGSIVDNAGAGGIYSAVDVGAGTSCTDAVDERGRVYRAHPDTGFVFKGFAIPDWEGMLSLAAEAAKGVPDIRLVGWDMALSEDGWMVVEGNCQPQLNVVQAATRTGMRPRLELDIEWDRNRKAASAGKG